MPLGIGARDSESDVVLGALEESEMPALAVSYEDACVARVVSELVLPVMRDVLQSCPKAPLETSQPLVHHQRAWQFEMPRGTSHSSATRSAQGQGRRCPALTRPSLRDAARSDRLSRV